MATVGLLSASCVLVSIDGAQVELAFHFFVTIALVMLYADGFPFLIAVGFVAVYALVSAPWSGSASGRPRPEDNPGCGPAWASC